MVFSFGFDRHDLTTHLSGSRSSKPMYWNVRWCLRLEIIGKTVKKEENKKSITFNIEVHMASCRIRILNKNQGLTGIGEYVGSMAYVIFFAFLFFWSY